MQTLSAILHYLKNIILHTETATLNKLEKIIKTNAQRDKKSSAVSRVSIDSVVFRFQLPGKWTKIFWCKAADRDLKKKSHVKNTNCEKKWKWGLLWEDDRKSWGSFTVSSWQNGVSTGLLVHLCLISFPVIIKAELPQTFKWAAHSPWFYNVWWAKQHKKWQKGRISQKGKNIRAR